MVSKLKVSRVKIGLTQEELGLKCNVPGWKISLFERGIPPRQSEAIEIAKALGDKAKRLFPIINHKEK